MTFPRRSRGWTKRSASGHLIQQGIQRLLRIVRPAPATEYQTWRRQFLANRLRLYGGLALPCYMTFAAITFKESIFQPDPELAQRTAEEISDPMLIAQLKTLLLSVGFSVCALLCICLLLLRTRWGRRYPGQMFLAISWSITLVPQMIGTAMRFPYPVPWEFIFLGQAVMVPVCWQMHLLSQLGSFLYYITVNLIPGLLREVDQYLSFDLGLFLSVFWSCLICNVTVSLYDRLQKREFESRRELQLFLHAVTHDLRTPVIGTSIVLQKLLQRAKAANNNTSITAEKLEQLLAGSDRQLNLIDSILEAHTSEMQHTFHYQPLQLNTLVQDLLRDLEPVLTQSQIVVTNRFHDQLPLVLADATQIWRVFSNLMTNAVKHNPNGIHLTLEATFQTPDLLRCTIQDNGVGIPPQQRQRLFELYYRGTRSRYMPGLGLGLYLCQQIIAAHSGQIGVISELGKGSTFWFTLPVVEPS